MLGNGQALLGMPDIEILDVLTINCNTIDMQTQNEQIYNKIEDWLQQQDIIAQLGVNKMVEWCNSFLLVPKPNGKVRLCLDPVRFNQELIQPVHKDPTLRDMFPKLTNAKYSSYIDSSSGYQCLRIDKQSSYLTTFTCQIKIQMTAIQISPSRQHVSEKVGKIFKELPKVVEIPDDTLVVGYDVNARDHDNTCRKNMQYI